MGVEGGWRGGQLIASAPFVSFFWGLVERARPLRGQHERDVPAVEFAVDDRPIRLDIAAGRVRVRQQLQRE